MWLWRRKCVTEDAGVSKAQAGSSASPPASANLNVELSAPSPAPGLPARQHSPAVMTMEQTSETASQPQVTGFFSNHCHGCAVSSQQQNTGYDSSLSSLSGAGDPEPGKRLLHNRITN